MGKISEIESKVIQVLSTYKEDLEDGAYYLETINKTAKEIIEICDQYNIDKVRSINLALFVSEYLSGIGGIPTNEDLYNEFSSRLKDALGLPQNYGNVKNNISGKMKVLYEVSSHRSEQDAKWGIQNHIPADWLMILGEEVGEANKAALEYRFGGYGVNDLSKFREELIQVAAVAVAIIECLDRTKTQKINDNCNKCDGLGFFPNGVFMGNGKCDCNNEV